MPHSGDRTVVSCAGDCEVRVFDLEYGGNNSTASDFSASTRSRRFNDFFSHARWLSDSNTNARVYRSHADRAKRVVTESSPFLFLTCSEDGEVRQWDLRLPSSAYPAPRGGRGFGRFRRSSEDDSGNVPPPLISYKKYALDLNSISCAASQPQYIALGGAHLHCFLHDRRMLGRDLSDEIGQPPGRMPTVGMHEDEAMSQATRCVKRFAPNEKRRMSSHDHGHITACKISDANPNEMVASWSGDHIYSFDIIKSPDARDAESERDKAFQATRLKNMADRKRKRKQADTSSTNLADNGNPSQRLRRVLDSHEEAGQTALRVRYENGESQDLAVGLPGSDGTAPPEVSSSALLSEAQAVSKRLATSLVQLRQSLFDFSSTLRDDVALVMEDSSELTPHTSSFTSTLGLCSTLLPQMDEVIRTWSYPVNPDSEEVTLQNTLRRNRQATWRFVQASGCLSRVLGARLQIPNAVATTDPRLERFGQIRPAIHEGKATSREARFCYDFVKAILSWLEGGREAVLKAFIRPSSVPLDSPRYPLTHEDTIESFVPKLHEHLSRLADEATPVADIDTNRFEHAHTRQVFPSQTAAVQAFTRALDGVQLRSGHGQSTEAPGSSQIAKRVMDRGAAARFWGVKVSRSLLMHAAEGVTFDFVNRAFGGLRIQLPPQIENERSQEDIDPEEEERMIEAIDILADPRTALSQSESTQDTTSDPSDSTARTALETAESPAESAEMVTPPTVLIEDIEDDDRQSDPEDNANDVSEEENDSDDDDDDDEGATQALFRRRVGFGRSKERASVNAHVPYSSHSKVYKGHCNTRTVKDVNYYGPNDEFVVSGSDDGHFFIWDRKTSKIVNILDGDGEVVNVIQGHPYEPMIACSGIDSTIKIFGPGGESRERDHAARGVDIANPSGGTHSSLPFGRRRRRQRQPDSDQEDEDNTNTAEQEDGEEEPAVTGRGLPSRKAMHKIYEITSQNDAERRRGMGDAFMTVGGMDALLLRAWIMAGAEII